MYVREGRPADEVPIQRIVDGVLLEHPPVGPQLEAGNGLVAIDGGRIVGTLLTESLERGQLVTAIAVTPRRRRAGIATVLVSSALTRTPLMVARFREDVIPFYRALGFSIDQPAPDRYRGVLRRDPG